MYVICVYGWIGKSAELRRQTPHVVMDLDFIMHYFFHIFAG